MRLEEGERIVAVACVAGETAAMAGENLPGAEYTPEEPGIEDLDALAAPDEVEEEDEGEDEGEDGPTDDEAR
jgi:hypothetical protein